jgi:hypothetical protein
MNFGVLASYLGRDQVILAEFCVVFNSIPSGKTTVNYPGLAHKHVTFKFQYYFAEYSAVGNKLQSSKFCCLYKVVYEIIYYITSN